MQWLRERPLPVRILVYAVALSVVLFAAAGVGAISALVLQNGIGFLSAEPQQRGEPRQGGEQAGADRQGQADVASPEQQEDTVGQPSEAEYVSRVADIQSRSVAAFLESDEKLHRYDILTDDDVEEMEISRALLKSSVEQVEDLESPRRYADQYEVFSSAIDELYEATALGYRLVADPTSATQAGFEAYEGHAGDAAAYLQQSNERLGRDFKTITGRRAVVL